MGVHSSDNRYFIMPTGSVKTQGGRLELAEDQVGLFAINHVTSKGAKAIESFAGLNTKHEFFELSQGINKQKMFNSRSRIADNKKSVPFKMNEVVKVGAYVPTNDSLQFDEYTVGYDGFTEGSSLTFRPGDNYQLQVNMFGKVPAWFNGGKTSKYSVSKSVVIPTGDFTDPCTDVDICASIDCKENTLKLVEQFNEHIMPDGSPLHQYLEVSPILECTGTTPETTYEKVFWELEYCGFGNDKELAKVQEQYPDYAIERDSLTKKFVVMLDEGETPEPFEVRLESYGVYGCDECPDGWTEVAGGQVYSVKLEDDGEDLTADIQALPGAVAGTAEKTGQVLGAGYYMVVLDDKLTEAEIEAFVGGTGEPVVGAHPTAEIIYVGTKQAICENDTVTTEEWVETGTCTYVKRDYVITLVDDCNGSKLEDLQAFYPELEITEQTTPAPQNCIRQYKTTVDSTISCTEGCSEIVQRVYNTEAPEPFGVNQYWVPAITASEETDCKCGIRFKGKPMILAAHGECLDDRIPFVYTSTRFTLGYLPNDLYLNTRVVPRSIAIRQWTKAKDVHNIGAELKGLQKESNAYFMNEQHYKDVLTRSLLGLSGKLDNFTLYADYFVQVDRKYQSQSVGGYAMDSIAYHFVVPVGQDAQVKKLVNMIAAEAEVPGV